MKINSIIKKINLKLTQYIASIRVFLNKNKEGLFLFFGFLFVFFYYYLIFNNNNKKKQNAIVTFLAKPQMHNVFKKYDIGLYSNCSFLLRTRLEDKEFNYNMLLNVIKKKAVKITKFNDKKYDISYDKITPIDDYQNDSALINKLIEFDENYNELHYKYEPLRCARVRINNRKTKVYHFRKPVILLDILINKKIKTDEDILDYFQAWIEFEALVNFWNQRDVD